MKSRLGLIYLIFALLLAGGFAGCEGGGGGNNAVPPGGSVTGGGSGTTGGAATTTTTGGGITTGAAATSSGGGITTGSGVTTTGTGTGTTGTTGTGTTGTTGTTATTGTTTTTTTTTGTAGQTCPVIAGGNRTATQVFTSNTLRLGRMTLLNNRVFFTAGFGQGQGEGRVFVFPIPVNTANPTAPVALRDQQGGAIITFNQPFDIINDGTNLYVADTNGGGNNTRVLRLSNLNFTNAAQPTAQVDVLAAGTTAANTPLFLLHLPNVGAAGSVYFSEYVANGARVRRIDLQNNTVTTVMQDLFYAAGLASDGVFLYIAENGANGNGVWRVPVNPATPLGKTSANVTQLTQPQGSQAGSIQRAFEVAVDSQGGLVIAAGFGFDGNLFGPGSLFNQGGVRYAGNPQATPFVDNAVLATGLSFVAGLSVVDTGMATQSGNSCQVATFVEAVSQPNGSANQVRYEVRPNGTVTAIVGPTELRTNFNLNAPIDTLPTTTTVYPVITTESWETVNSVVRDFR